MEQEIKNTKNTKSLLSHFVKLFILLSMLLSVLYFGITLNTKIEKLAESNNDIPVFDETQNNNEIEDDESKDVYCLKEYNGKIGIYKNDALVYTIDRFIFTLPDNDKKLLKEGIYTTDPEELYKILEQYY